MFCLYVLLALLVMHMKSGLGIPFLEGKPLFYIDAFFHLVCSFGCIVFVLVNNEIIICQKKIIFNQLELWFCELTYSSFPWLSIEEEIMTTFVRFFFHLIKINLKYYKEMYLHDNRNFDVIYLPTPLCLVRPFVFDFEVIDRKNLHY